MLRVRNGFGRRNCWRISEFSGLGVSLNRGSDVVVRFSMRHKNDGNGSHGSVAPMKQTRQQRRLAMFAFMVRVFMMRMLKPEAARFAAFAQAFHG